MARHRKTILNPLVDRGMKTAKRPMVEILKQEFLRERAQMKELEESIGQSAQSSCNLPDRCA